VLDNGNLLLVSSNGTVNEYDRAGNAITGPGSINFPFASGSAGDPEGVVPSNGTLFFPDDGFNAILESDLSGVILNNFPAAAIHMDLDEPSGIDLNPLNGNLVVSSDSSLFESFLWEIAINRDAGGDTATFVDVVNLSDLISLNPTILNLCNSGRLANGESLGGPCRDGEGLAVDPFTNRFFIGYEEAQVILTGTFNVPEPSALVLLGGALLALASLRRSS
jgi:hypothetical protein